MKTLLVAAIALLVALPASAGWDEENSMMSNSSVLLDVSAVSSSRAYAVGVMDTGSTIGVVMSTSGGGSWSTVFQQNDTLIGAVHFRDSSEGYIGGLAIQGFSFTPFIKRTLDGGASFTDTTVPTGGVFDAEMIQGITFAPNGDGWALTASGTAWRSTDGGNTWVETTLPGDGPIWNDIYFVDADHGWIVGAVPGEDPGDDDTSWKDDRGGPSDGTILRTTDGGDSWEVVHSGLSVDLQGVRFMTASRGIIVGSDDTLARIYTTEDGGQTLDAASLPTDAEGRSVNALSQVAVPCGNQAWAVGAIHTSESGETGISAILFSSDGGRTWSLDPWPQDFVEGQFDMKQYHFLYDVDFADSETGFASGSELSILGYSGEGLECTPPEEDPMGDDGGAGSCSCGKGEETAARQALPQLLLACSGLALLGVRRRR